MRAAARPDACLPGAVYGDGYRGLLANARCYVHATEVGGTHPALVEAMGAGNLCLVLDTPENREVAGEVAWYFADGAELARLLEQVDALSPDALDDLRACTRSAAMTRYSWDTVAQAYDRLLFGGGPGPRPPERRTDRERPGIAWAEPPNRRERSSPEAVGPMPAR